MQFYRFQNFAVLQALPVRGRYQRYQPPRNTNLELYPICMKNVCYFEIRRFQSQVTLFARFLFPVFNCSSCFFCYCLSLRRCSSLLLTSLVCYETILVWSCKLFFDYSPERILVTTISLFFSSIANFGHYYFPLSISRL